MQFYDASNNTGLVDDVYFITGADTTSYPLKDVARNVNRHYYKAVIDALKADGRLQYDDSNQTTLPEYTFTLVNNQKDYSLPTNLFKLWGLEVCDAAGNWTRLQEIDLQDPVMKRTITDFEDTAGVPKYYDIRGDSVFLHPAPATASMTLTNGGKMYFSREIDAFTASDTTQEPGLPEPFHRILSLGAAIDWLLINDTTSKVDRFLQMYEQLRQEMRAFYSDRNKDRNPGLRPAHDIKNYL